MAKFVNVNECEWNRRWFSRCENASSRYPPTLPDLDLVEQVRQWDWYDTSWTSHDCLKSSHRICQWMIQYSVCRVGFYAPRLHLHCTVLSQLLPRQSRCSRCRRTRAAMNLTATPDSQSLFRWAETIQAVPEEQLSPKSYSWGMPTEERGFEMEKSLGSRRIQRCFIRVKLPELSVKSVNCLRLSPSDATP